MSCTTRPVTQTAEVAVKRASSKGVMRPLWDAKGSISSSAPAEGVDDPTADNFTAESTPAEEAPAEPEATPEPTPEPTPVPEYEGLSVQPTTYYNEGEQPTYTVTDGNNLNMRGGPGTDYDKIGQVPASTGVTALGTNEDGSWVVVNYNGTYGWLKTEFLNG